VLANQRRDLTNPPLTREGYLDALSNYELKKTVEALRASAARIWQSKSVRFWPNHPSERWWWRFGFRRQVMPAAASPFHRPVAAPLSPM